MDPLLGAVGGWAARTAATEGSKILGRALLDWAKGDEVTRLFFEVEKRFPNIPGASATALAPLREDEAFVRALVALRLTGEFDREAIVASLERHVGPTDDLSARELAERLADEIRRVFPRAQKETRDAILVALELLRDEMRPARAVRFLTGDWAPPFTLERVKALAASDPEAAEAIDETLSASAEPRKTLVGLIRDPPSWLVEASHRTWRVVAELADGYGLWESAERAFLAASERPGADRSGILAQAAMSAEFVGARDRYEEHLRRAKELDEEHDDVIRAELLTVVDPAARLQRLERVTDPEDGRRAAILDALRAYASIELSRFEDAEAQIARAAERNPSLVGLRELRPLLILHRNRTRVASGRAPETAALRDAADDYLHLREDFVASARYSESGRLLASAVESYALAGDLQRAGKLLETELRDEERQERLAAVDLAEAALVAHRPDLVADLLDSGASSERERLALAEADVMSGDEAAVANAIVTLEALLDSGNEAIRNQAALTRQIATLAPADVGSSDRAQAILESSSPIVAAMLAAERLTEDGDYKGAEARLLPHVDDARALRLLIRFAGRREQWDRVIELSRPLLAGQPAAEDRLVYVDALRRSGSRAEAVRELAALRTDSILPDDARASAFRLSAELATEDRNFGAVEQITRDWLQFDAGSADAAWLRLHALLRLSRFADALDVVEEMRLQPRSLEQAEVLAAAYERAAEPAEAIRRIGELSDLFGRPESLEALFLVTTLRVDIDERVPELGERIRTGFEEFAQRFPESRAIKLIRFDPSEDGIDAFFREHVEPGARHVRQLHEQLLAGELPVAALAAAVGKPVAFVWGRLSPAMPLGYGDPTLDALERDDAAAAIGRAVVRDPSSLFVPAVLGGRIEEAIRAAFPASVVAQATLDDGGRATSMPASERSEHFEIGYDPARDERWRREWAPEEVREERELLRRVLDVARALTVVPDVSRERPTDLDQFLAGDDPEAAFATWPASFAVAQREQKPIYSDDRFIRAHARRGGIAAFGTIAVLDALAARGLISDDERLEARRALRRRGGLGIATPAEELVEEGRAHGWKLTLSLGHALLDPTPWRCAPAEAFRTWVTFLRGVFNEAPDELDAWVARIIDAGDQALRRDGGIGVRPFAERSLALMAWLGSTSKTRAAFLRAILRAFRAMRTTLGWSPDPLLGVGNDLAQLLGEAEHAPFRTLLLTTFLQDVAFYDQLRLLGVPSLDPRWSRLVSPRVSGSSARGGA